MEQFPSNSKRPVRSRDEPKNIERVVRGDVVRRKTPLGRRMAQNLIGGDVQSVWGFMFGEVLIPAARDMIYDAFTGGMERAIFGEDRRMSRRGVTSRYGSPPGHTPYNRMARDGRHVRDDGPRQMSRRGRANHSFDEIILTSRVEAEEVIDRLEDLADRYEAASVADLYGLVGISGNYTDDKWGWNVTDIRMASVSRARNGYLLNLPKPEPID